MIQLEIREKGKAKRTFTCEVLPVTLGTHSYDTVLLCGPEASKGYCVLDKTKDGYRIGGTYHPDKVSINKKPFSGSPLEAGDIIRIGQTKITVLKIRGQKQWTDAVSDIMKKDKFTAKMKTRLALFLKTFSKKVIPSRETKTEPLPVIQQKHAPHKPRMKSVLVWTVSLILHGILCLIALLITVTEQHLDEIIASLEMELIKEPLMHISDAVKREIQTREITVNPEIDLEESILTEELTEITEPELSLPEKQESSGMSEDLKVLSHVNKSSNNWNSVLGIHAGGGAFGSRSASGKTGALKRFGGSEETEGAVKAALEWFKRHQSPDGSWSMTSFSQECTHQPRCGGLASDESREFPEWWDNCGTGLALLCFLGAGNTHEKGDYKEEVYAGILNLLTNQSRNGSFAGKGCYHDANYVHAITAMALCEAYGMTRDIQLQGPAQKAVDYIISRQNRFLGWDYDEPGERNDTSVTGWQVMALKSAYTSGLNIGNSFDGAKRLFSKITPGIQDSEVPLLKDHCAYLYFRDNDNQAHRNQTMTAISMLGRILTGDSPESSVIQAHANTLIESPPRDFSKADLYSWYYATLALFQSGGGHWETWNSALKPLLVNTQCIGGCADGSWNPPQSWSCRTGGRVFTTAMACLCLEVYYRYSPLMLLTPGTGSGHQIAQSGEIAGRVRVIQLPNYIKASVKANQRTYIAFDQQVARKLIDFDRQIVKIQCAVLKDRGKFYIDGIGHIELFRKTPGTSIAEEIDKGLFGFPCREYTDELENGGGFGYFIPQDEDDPFAGYYHLGEDVQVPAGTGIRSIGDGIVRNAGFSPTIKDPARGIMYGFGYFVIIEHKLEKPLNGTDHVCSLYVHLSEKLAVKPGDRVYKGQPIGYVGKNMSRENGMYQEHLHFGIHKGKYHQLSETLKAHLEKTASEKGMYIRLPENSTSSVWTEIEGRKGKWELVKGAIQGMMDEGNGTVHVMFEDGRTSVINTMMPVHGDKEEMIPFWCRGYGSREFLEEWVMPSAFIKLFQDSKAKPVNEGDQLVMKLLNKRNGN